MGCIVIVLHLVKTAVGAEWALRQMRELVTLGLTVHVAMPPGRLEDAYRAAGVNVHLADVDFPANAPWRLSAIEKRFARLVDEVGPDLIHSHFVGTTLTMRVALGKHHTIPRVFQVPGPLHLEHRLFRSVELASAGTPDYWIGSCRWTCEAYRRAGVSADRVFLSYYGTDLGGASSGASAQQACADIRARGSKVVGLIAYMYPPKWFLAQRRGLKGHEDLIDALQICRERHPDLVGVFVGGAWNNARWYYDRVVAYGLSKDAYHNVFLGTRRDVRDLYGAVDVAVCPSHSENVGAAVESLLCGVPTIASNVGGLPDLIQDGQTGWLVPPKDPVALSEAILSALHDEQTARGRARNGQQLARQLFDVRRTAAEVAQIYRRIVFGEPAMRQAPGDPGVREVA